MSNYHLSNCCKSAVTYGKTTQAYRCLSCNKTPCEVTAMIDKPGGVPTANANEISSKLAVEHTHIINDSMAEEARKSVEEAVGGAPDNPARMSDGEYITNYDLRGEWTRQEFKDSIRRQINEKIRKFLSTQKAEMLSAIKGLGCEADIDGLTIAKVLNILR